jgi:hypothetical protein
LAYWNYFPKLAILISNFRLSLQINRMNNAVLSFVQRTIQETVETDDRDIWWRLYDIVIYLFSADQSGPAI